MLKKDRDSEYSDNSCKLIFDHTYSECPKKYYSYPGYEYPIPQPYETSWSEKPNCTPTYWIKLCDGSILDQFDENGGPVKESVLFKINSPITLKGFTAFPENYIMDGLVVNRNFKTEYVDVEAYLNAVDAYKNKYYLTTTDPRMQSAANIERLANAILKGGELDPRIICSLKDDVLYKVDYQVGGKQETVYYNSEEISSWLWGYAANRKFNFSRSEYALAFGMQYFGKINYVSFCQEYIYDTPWKAKAIEEGWMYVNKTYFNARVNYGMNMMRRINSSYLIYGIGFSDLVDVTLLVYTGGQVSTSVVVKMSKPMVTSALINWLTQVAVIMIADDKTFSEATFEVSYKDVLWTGVTVVVKNQTEIMALDCMHDMVNRYDELQKQNVDNTNVPQAMGFACAKSLIKNVVFGKLLSEPNSYFGKYLKNSWRNKSLHEVKLSIARVFNCTPTEVEEILRVIPAEILKELMK